VRFVVLLIEVPARLFTHSRCIWHSEPSAVNADDSHTPRKHSEAANARTAARNRPAYHRGIQGQRRGTTRTRITITNRPRLEASRIYRLLASYRPQKPCYDWLAGLTFSHYGRAVAYETKTPTGRLLPEQEKMMQDMVKPPNVWTVAVIRSFDEYLEALHKLYPK